MNVIGPLVSVIIPNFNYLSYIDRCMESVLNQDYQNIEIIVVDDGSTDGSVEFLKSLTGNLRVIQQSNQGVAAARNRGFFEAKGEYIAFLDSDDYWDTSKISKQIRAIKKTGADLVYSGINLVAPDGTTLTGVLKPEFMGNCAREFRRFPSKAIILLGCSSALFKKSVVCNSGLFDTNLSISADWDFFRRYCDFGSVTYVEELLTFYRQHPQNMSSNSNFFISDTLRCVQKMLMDDHGSKKSFDKLLVMLRTYRIVIKYWIKNR